MIATQTQGHPAKHIATLELLCSLTYIGLISSPTEDWSPRTIIIHRNLLLGQHLSKTFLFMKLIEALEPYLMHMESKWQY